METEKISEEEFMNYFLETLFLTYKFLDKIEHLRPNKNGGNREQYSIEFKKHLNEERKILKREQNEEYIRKLKYLPTITLERLKKYQK